MTRRKSSGAKLVASILFALIVLAIIISVGPRVDRISMNGSSAVLSRLDGASDYTEQCVRCHGVDGHSQTTKGRQTHAADLTKSQISDVKGIKIITNGQDSMPAFKKDLGADQIKEVMAYIHVFRQ